MKDIDFSKIAIFGIAGNFTNHLEQAGESNEFNNITTKENEPKGIFPVYIPNNDTFLGTFALSNKILALPQIKEDIQMEPELAFLYDVVYDNNMIKKLTKTHFCSYNDATIRKDGVLKISLKKNWGENSKGISKNLLDVKNNNINNFAISSYVKRENKFI